MVSAEIFLRHLPVFLLVLFFLSGYLCFVILKKRVPPPNNDSRIQEKSPILPRWIKEGFFFLLHPFVELLVQLRVHPHAITFSGFILSGLAGIEVARGYLEWGGFFYVLSGFCDFLDGQVARLSGKVTREGGILDSLLDRLSDAFVLGGTLYFYRLYPLPFLLALSALIVSFLIPYLRAKGEAVGIPMAIGALQRQERVVILAVAFLLSPLLREYGLDHPSFPYPLLLISLGIQLLLGISTILVRTARLLEEKKEQG